MKNLFGKAVGAFGGLLSGSSAAGSPARAFGEKLRSFGGQVTGGQRTFNIVPQVKAAEPQIINWGPSQENAPWNQQYQNQSNQTNNPTTGTPTGEVKGTTTDQGQQPLESEPGAPDTSFIEQLLAPALSGLDALEAETRSLLGGGEAEADAFASAGKARAEQTKAEGLGAIEGQRGKVKSEAGEAEAQQRRGFAEISQNLLGRFGRSGFGQGVIGSLGENTMQQVGKIRASLEQTMNELFTQQTNIEKELNTAVEEVNFKSEQLKQAAKANLQQALAQIGSARGELQTRRAEMVNSALENYRQQVIQVNARNTAYQQKLSTIKAEADQRIREAQAKATNIAEKLSLQNIYTPMGTQQSVLFNPRTGKVSPVSFEGTNLGGFGQTAGGGLTPEKKKILEEGD